MPDRHGNLQSIPRLRGRDEAGAQERAREVSNRSVDGQVPQVADQFQAVRLPAKPARAQLVLSHGRDIELEVQAFSLPPITRHYTPAQRDDVPTLVPERRRNRGVEINAGLAHAFVSTELTILAGLIWIRKDFHAHPRSGPSMARVPGGNIAA